VGWERKEAFFGQQQVLVDEEKEWQQPWLELF
jgi:hypothetical protein